MSVPARAVVLALVLVLAGCQVPINDDNAPTQTPSPTPEAPAETTTPTPTPTPEEESPYPPGVNGSTVTNVSELLAAHTTALNETGYIAVGSGNTTILRSGFLVSVTRDVHIVVANGSNRYHEVRRTEAGPVDRLVKRYSNGSVEFRRHEENDEVNYRRREPQSPEKLANVGTLDSFLRGGEFRVVEVRNETSPVTIVLRANSTANETALRSTLPDGAREIRTYDATVEVDGEGRIRSLEAAIGFVIGGNNRTHVVSFTVSKLGVKNISEPDWVAELKESNDSTDARRPLDGPGDRRPAGSIVPHGLPETFVPALQSPARRVEQPDPRRVRHSHDRPPR